MSKLRMTNGWWWVVVLREPGRQWRPLIPTTYVRHVFIDASSSSEKEWTAAEAAAAALEVGISGGFSAELEKI